jgi:uncharacterized protein
MSMNPVKAAALLLLRAYKWAVSPLLLPACRYVPTCSEYAMEAITRYGVVRGGTKSVWRLLRCHPLAKGGVDPVVKNSHHPVASSTTGLCSH